MADDDKIVVHVEVPLCALNEAFNRKSVLSRRRGYDNPIQVTSPSALANTPSQGIPDANDFLQAGVQVTAAADALLRVAALIYTSANPSVPEIPPDPDTSDCLVQDFQSIGGYTNTNVTCTFTQLVGVSCPDDDQTDCTLVIWAYFSGEGYKRLIWPFTVSCQSELIQKKGHPETEPKSY